MAFSYVNYTGNGTTTQFSITFTYQNTSEISVTVDGVAQAGLTFPSSSTVQLTSAPAVGTLVQVRRTTNLAARAVDFASGSVLTEEDLDDSNIQVFHAAQESTDLAGDSIQLGNDNKWDAQSSVIKNVGTPTASTDAATKAYTDTEVAGVVSSAVTQATAAATTTAQAEVAAATSTIIPDATKLAIHPIGTQYTLSDGVTTDYSSKHYANVASTNATTATNAAATASTDAGTASSAATAAQVAQAAAEAALDTFDDRFLGAKASDPSVDNDGNALLDGAIYFNTTSDIMKVYDATNTVWHDLALTGTDQTNVNLVAGQISPTNNIGTLAGISSDITTVAGNNANVTTVATDIVNVNAVGTDIANVNTVATNLTNVNAFADTYFISPTAPASPTLGDLWFDTTNDIMKVYSSSGFVNAGSSVNGTANRYVYTATSGQTSFAATYDAGYVDVYLNGVKLQSGTDFTATDGANVVLTVGAALNDQIDIVGYGTFNIAIPDISGDSTPQLGGDLATSGNDITFGDNDKAIFGAGSDLQIYHDGLSSYVADVGTGDLRLTSNGAAIRIHADQINLSNAAGSKDSLIALNGGATTIHYDNAAKLATTATGVDVTGTVTADGLTVDGDVTLNDGSPNLRLQDTDVSRFGDISYGTRVVSVTNTMASGEDMDTVQPWMNFRFKDDGETREVLRLNYNGNVGIGDGTLSPTSMLHIYKSGATADLALQSAGASGRKHILQSKTDGALAFYDNNAGTERMRIDGSGNVGIGTSNVTSPFVVNTSFNSGYLSQFVNTGTGSDPNGVLIQAGVVDSAYVLRLQKQNASDVLVVRGSGNVGIGITSPTQALVVSESSTPTIQIKDGAASGTRVSGRLHIGEADNLGVSIENSTNSFNDNCAMVFKTSPAAGTITERMRIDSGGNVVIAKTTTSNTVQGITLGVDGQLNCVIQNAGGAQQAIFINRQDATGNAILFRYQNGTVGSIAINASSTSYNTSSDYRLKENVTADWDATTRLKQLNPVRFNFISDADTTVDGFLAHEVQDIVPEAISGTKDGMRDEEYEVTPAVLDDDDNEVTPAVMGTRSVPDYQGIDQSKLVPLLVKTIQELEARITALENV